MQPIAKIYTDFPEKFGLPRQSGLVENLRGKIVFEPEYRDISAVRGLEEYSHIWLLWEFSGFGGGDWSPTVRPPRLGGNVRMGVFATRSPFRPNPVGLSSVKLEGVEKLPGLGTVLHISGADLMDGTPILDVKPYIPGSDLHTDAAEGFSGPAACHTLEVVFPEALLTRIPQEKRAALIEVLSQDPRPAYQRDPGRIYGFPFAGVELRFCVDGGCLTVQDVLR